jgi:hypothetical protein
VQLDPQRLAGANDVGVTAFFGGWTTPVQYVFGAQVAPLR